MSTSKIAKFIYEYLPAGSIVQIKDKLNEYFKAQNLFYVDNESGFGILKVEANKPKILVIE